MAGPTNSGGVMTCQAPGEPGGGAAFKRPQVDTERPARKRNSCFGNDEELANELPPTWTLRRFQEEATRLLSEYFTERALEEAFESARDLLADCPSEADEFAVLAIRMALDYKVEVQEAVVKLLCRLGSGSALDSSALVRSFEKLFCTWEDITIDVPKTPEALLQILHGCISGNAVEGSIVSKLPENLLNAGLAKAGPDLAGLLSGVAAELKQFKKRASLALEEYFVALNVEEVKVCLDELGSKPYRHELVKKAIIMSFSQANQELSRDAVLRLFAELTIAGVLSKDDLQWGVTRLLGQLDDLELDCPRCAELASDMCSGMVGDELVSIPFLRRCRLLRIGGATGLRVLDAVQRRTPEYSKKHLSTAQFKREIETMILEYFDSGDKEEFARCVREIAPLAVEQSAELVRKIMVLAMERTGGMCEMSLVLLVWLCRQEELDNVAIEAGFDDLYTRMPDLLLDVPDAEEMTRAFVVEAKKAGLLRRSWPEPEEV